MGVEERTLGQRIAAMRGARGMSQGDLAEALEVSRQSVSKWETDASIPELGKLVQLSELFEVSLDELVRGAAPAAPPKAAPAPESGAGRREIPLERRIAGIVLLCAGGAAALLLFLLGGGWFALAVGAVLAGCGILCLRARAHAGYGCAVILWLSVELYLRLATGLSWSVILATGSWTADMNYTGLAIGWIMAAVAVALILWGGLSLGRPRFLRDKPWGAAAAWGAAVGLFLLRAGVNWAMGKWLFTPSGPAVSWAPAVHLLAAVLGDWLLAAALVLSVTCLPFGRTRSTSASQSSAE